MFLCVMKNMGLCLYMLIEVKCFMFVFTYMLLSFLQNLFNTCLDFNQNCADRDMKRVWFLLSLIKLK